MIYQKVKIHVNILFLIVSGRLRANLNHPWVSILPRDKDRDGVRDC